MLISGGFGVRGIEGGVGAIKYARAHRIPLLGLCLGLQCLVVEAARHLAGLEGADSTEFDPATPHPVIATMAARRTWWRGSGTSAGRSLGLYRAVLAEGTLVRELYGEPAVEGTAPAPVRGEQRLP